MALSISGILYFFPCVPQSAFGTIQRRLACPSAGVDTHQSRSAVKFCVAQPLRILCVFFLSLLKGGISCCIVLASYRRVSLIVESVRLAELSISLVHCCGVVVRSLVSRYET